MLSRLIALSGTIFTGVLLFQMLRLWISPDSDSGDAIQTFAVLVGFEFIMVHSAIFMLAMPKKVSLFFFAPLYGVFALVFNLFAPGNTVLWLYLAVVASRMRFSFSNPSEDQMAKVMLLSVIAVTVYFFCMMGFAIGNALVPKFGLTTEFLDSIGYAESLRHGGMYLEEPHIAMATGVVYFAVLLLVELRLFVFPSKSTKQPASRQDRGDKIL